nr:hypothetical protein [Brochothrix thermosphacta]
MVFSIVQIKKANNKKYCWLFLLIIHINIPTISNFSLKSSISEKKTNSSPREEILTVHPNNDSLISSTDTSNARANSSTVIPISPIPNYKHTTKRKK